MALLDFAFCDAMERVLQMNRNKTWWSYMSLDEILKRIRQEVNEVAKELREGNEEDAAAEVVDVANFCMMFWQNAQRGRRRRFTTDSEADEHARMFAEGDYEPYEP